MTQEEFAREVGVSFSTVSRWETGRGHPSPLALHRLQEKARIKLGDSRPAVLLCGPITNVIRGGTFDSEVRRLIEGIAKRLDRAGFDVLSAHKVESFGESIPKQPSEVFLRDWDFAKTSRAIVAVLPSTNDGGLIRTDGTYIEIGWAVALQKPLFMVLDSELSSCSYLLDGLLEFHAERLTTEEALNSENWLLRLASAVGSPAKGTTADRDIASDGGPTDTCSDDDHKKLDSWRDD